MIMLKQTHDTASELDRKIGQCQIEQASFEYYLDRFYKNADKELLNEVWWADVKEKLKSLMHENVLPIQQDLQKQYDEL